MKEDENSKQTGSSTEAAQQASSRVTGLTEDQRIQLRDRLHALATGTSGALATPIVMVVPGSSHWNYWS